MINSGYDKQTKRKSGGKIATNNYRKAAKWNDRKRERVTYQQRERKKTYQQSGRYKKKKKRTNESDRLTNRERMRDKTDTHRSKQ